MSENNPLFPQKLSSWSCFIVPIPGEEVLPNGIPFVIKSDLQIISYNKEPAALCVFMRKLAIEQGLAEMEIEFHVSVPAHHPALDARFKLGNIVSPCVRLLTVLVCVDGVIPSEYSISVSESSGRWY